MSIYKTDEEIKELLEHPKNGLNKVNVDVRIIGSGNHGNQAHDDKKNGHQRRDIETKVDAAVLASIIGNGPAATLMNLSPSAVSKYSHGKNSNNTHIPELVEKVDERLNKIAEKAIDRVGVLLDIFAEDKISELKASEIPSAADKLMGVVEKVNKKTGNENLTNKPSVIIYAPRQLTVNEYMAKEV